MAKIILDRSRCTGLGICESFADTVFSIQPDGRLELVIDSVDGALLEAVREACDSCPTEALRLEY